MLRHSIRFTLTAILAATSANHVLADTVPNTFASGEVIDAERINENFSFLSSRLSSLPKTPANRIYDRIDVERETFISFTNDFGKKIRIENITHSGCGLRINGIELPHNGGSWQQFLLVIEAGQTVTFKDCRSSDYPIIISYLED